MLTINLSHYQDYFINEIAASDSIFFYLMPTAADK